MANNMLTQIGYTGQRRFQSQLGKFSLTFNTDDDIPEGCPVKLVSDNKVGVCTADDFPIGICMVRPNEFYGQGRPSPTRTTIALAMDEAVLMVRATANIVAGAEVMIDGVDVTSTTQGEWIVKGKTATTGKVVIGIALEAGLSGTDVTVALRAYKKA